jgi:NTP pyrophosphatase (non-canonical NTP hydrolase)
MPMTLQRISQIQAEFDSSHEERFSFYGNISADNIDVLEHLIVCLVGEVGEFANLTKKIRRGDLQFQENKEGLDEELADVFIYLIKISNHLRTDLEGTFLRKLEKNRKRFASFEK